MRNKPLSEKELNQLDLFLQQAKGNIENVEKLDGFFCALICGPELILPGEYLPQVWGDFDFESEEQAKNIVDLIFRHWNFIVSELNSSASSASRGLYMPVLWEDENGISLGNDWAAGFMSGVQIRPGSWEELVEEEERAGALIPVMMLHHENHPDPDMRTPAITEEKREWIFEMMIASLSLTYQYFAPHRRRASHASSHTTVHRDDRKIGRNEPCPCNSGRKFKHCCADEYATIH